MNVDGSAQALLPGLDQVRRRAQACEYDDLVERAGFEPATSAVRGQRSPS
jgi:hypothetical protein